MSGHNSSAATTPYAQPSHDDGGAMPPEYRHLFKPGSKVVEEQPRHPRTGRYITQAEHDRLHQ